MPRKNRSRVSLRVGVEQQLAVLYRLEPGVKVNDVQVNNLLEFVFQEFSREEHGHQTKERFWAMVEEKEKEREKPRSKEAIWQAKYRAKKKLRMEGGVEFADIPLLTNHNSPAGTENRVQGLPLEFSLLQQQHIMMQQQQLDERLQQLQGQAEEDSTTTGHLDRHSQGQAVLQTQLQAQNQEQSQEQTQGQEQGQEQTQEQEQGQGQGQEQTQEQEQVQEQEQGHEHEHEQTSGESHDQGQSRARGEDQEEGLHQNANEGHNSNGEQHRIHEPPKTIDLVGHSQNHSEEDEDTPMIGLGETKDEAE